MALHIFNTLTRNKDPFEPVEPGKIKFYACGPTVYDLSHVGHARVYVAFDTVVRFLRRHHTVTYVRNYTDVDDKIIKRAAEGHKDPSALAQQFIDEFEADMAALGNQPPDIMPRVTGHMPQILAMIGALIDKGAAYAAAGDVYYAVQSFATYGQLSRRSLEDMEAGARVEVSAQKRHPMDFALWKAAKPGEPSWESPWGAGRPGWHIECSAMSKAYLGETFDIHAGGRDLIFPHHENEIAQSEASCGKTMARVWMHNGLVNIDNEKMSKSLGNFFTIRQVLEKFDAQTLRYYLLATHYRSPINFSDAALTEAEHRVRYLYETLVRLDAALAGQTPPADGPLRQDWVTQVVSKFDAAMQDDFNTPEAIGALSDPFRLINDILAKPQDAQVDLRTLFALKKVIGEVADVLGLFAEPPQAVLDRIHTRLQAARKLDPAAIERRIAERAAARAAKDFKAADAIRQALLAEGVSIKDTASGTTWEPV
jgi:cysteinyl-tRNA synthetase